MSRGPYTVQGLKPSGVSYVPEGRPMLCPTMPEALKCAHALYHLTGIVPDMTDANGKPALHNDDVGNWGLR